MTRGAGPLQAATEAASVKHGKTILLEQIVTVEKMAVAADRHVGGVSLGIPGRIIPCISHTLHLALPPTRPQSPQAGQAGDRSLSQLLSRVSLQPRG